MAYHVLARVTLDSGVKLYAFAGAGFISPSVYWEPRLLSVGSVNKSLSEEVGGPMSVGTMAISLDDTDGTFLSLRTAEGWLNRKLEVLLYDEDAASYAAGLSVAWEGEISNWASSDSGDVWELEAHDISEQRLEESLGTINPTDVLDISSFPNLPDSTPRNLVPLVIGKVASDEPGGSNKGSVPAYLVDNSSASAPVYVVCQGNAKTGSVVPYRYGVKLTSGFTQANATYGSRPYTILTFTSAQLDADRSNEQEITCDVETLSDLTTTGAAITNPAALLERFLLQAGISSGEIDATTSFTAAKNTFSGRGISGAFCLVDGDQSLGETLRDFGSSFNLSLTRTLTGNYGAHVPAPGKAVAPIVISEEAIVRGSFAMRGVSTRATGATYRYLKDWRVDDESYHATASTSDPGEVSLLGRAVGRSYELPYIRTGDSAIKVVGDKLFSVSDKRVVVSVEVLPNAALLDVDIGTTVSLLWRDGIMPFEAQDFRVTARNLVFNPMRIQLTLASTTISAFTFGTEFLGVRQKPPPIRTDYDTRAGDRLPGMLMELGLRNNTR